MIDIRIAEIPIPAVLDDSPEARDFADAIEVGNAAESASVGSDEMTHDAEETLPGWQDLEKAPKSLVIARVDGRIVGSATVEWRTEGPAAGESWQMVAVHPDAQGIGVGRALADHLEQLARSQGKARIIARVNSVDRPGERLEPRSGWGSVPRDNREVRFLQNRGYAFHQITRMSRLPLPADPGVLETNLARAHEKAGDEYRLLFWGDRTPERWRADMVMQMTRLDEDVPLAGIPMAGLGDASPRTLERFLDEEEKAAAGPTRQIVAAVEHVPTGTLAGFTNLFVPARRDHPIGQGATIVIAEHRGHRLSMLLKIANIRYLNETHPGHPSIVTGNAEENRFMLDVNEALGFVPIAAQGVWTKEL
jgi:GNAT superfamily N-acetyltransferase